MKTAKFTVSGELIEKLIGLPEGSLMTIDTRVVNGKKRIWLVVEHDALPNTTPVGATIEGIAECHPTFGKTVDGVPVVLAWNPRAGDVAIDAVALHEAVTAGTTAENVATKSKGAPPWNGGSHS